MSEILPDAVEASTVRLPVEANTRGFAEDLRVKLKKELKRFVVKVNVAPDADKFREELRAKVEEESAGVSVDVEVNVDADTLRARLEAAVRAAASGVSASVGVDVDSNGLRNRLKVAAEEAAAGVGATVDVEATPRKGMFARLRDVFRRETENKPIPVGVAPSINKSAFERTLADLGKAGRVPGGRLLFRLSIVQMVLSLIGPLISALGGGLAGLAAMAANLSTALSTLSVAPLLLGAVGLALGSLLITFRAFGSELKDTSPSIKALTREAKSLADAWKSLQANVAESTLREMVGFLKPAGERVLPLLSTALASVGQQLGITGRAMLEWFASDKFEANFTTNSQTATRFMQSLRKMLFGTSPAIDGVSEATGGLVHWLSDLAVATEPLLDRFGALLTRFGEWTSTLLDTPQEMGEFKDFLDYAASKGAQAGRMIQDIWTGLTGIFRAGRGTGDSLLGSFENTLQRFTDWANSPDGQARIEEFFRNIEPTARAFAGLIGDIFRALGQLSEDANTAALLEMLSTDLLPAITNFLQNIGSTLGPSVVTLVSSVLEAFANFVGDGGALVPILDAIQSFFGALNDFYNEASPADQERLQMIGVGLGAIITALTLAKRLGLLGVLTGLTSGLASLFTGPALTGGGLGGRGAPGTPTTGGRAGTPAGGGIFGGLTGRGGMLVRWVGAPTVTVLGGGGAGAAGGTGRGGAPGGVVTGSGRRAATPTPPRRPLSTPRGRAGGIAGLIATLAASVGLSVLSDGEGGARDQWANAGNDTLSGLAIGATVGSVVPGIGTIVGGLVGSFLGALRGITNAIVGPQKEDAKEQSEIIREWNERRNRTDTRLQLGGDRPSRQEELLRQGRDDTAPGVNTAPQGGLNGSFGGSGGLSGFAASRGLTAKAIAKEMAAANKEVEVAQRGLDGALATGLGKLRTFGVEVAGPVATKLRGAGSTAINGLANAMPPGVRSALTALGVFPAEAPGDSRVNLAPTGRSNLQTLIAGINPGVGLALTALGLFPSQAPAKSKADLTGSGKSTTKTLHTGVSTTLPGVLGLFSGLGGRIRGTIGKIDLSGTGSSIIGSLRRGMETAFGAIKASLQTLTKSIPKWKGPEDVDSTLLTPAGRSIIGSLLGGLESEYPAVMGSLRGLTGAIAATPFGVGTVSSTRPAPGDSYPATAPVSPGVGAGGGGLFDMSDRSLAALADLVTSAADRIARGLQDSTARNAGNRSWTRGASW